ncbi:MAG: YhjD/YihY/BrkB family envelope integrity protein, partial [Planctomycetota bacterium]
MLRVLWITVKSFRENTIMFRASALTYVTVLSLVPLVAVTFTLAKGMGFYKSLRQDTIGPYLDSMFGAAGEGGEAGGASSMAELRGMIDGLLDAVETTNFASLGAVGLAALFYAVIRLMGTIEQSLNIIWNVQKSRTFLRKVSDYLTMILITPLFLFTAVGVSTGAKSNRFTESLYDFFSIQVGEEKIDPVTGLVENRVGLENLIDFLLQFTPYFTMWVGFTVVYLVVPNTNTKFSSAVIGGIFAGTLWNFIQQLFVGGVIKVATYNSIYAGFVSFPILMIWIYFSWVTVLLGAEVASAHQGEEAYRHIALSRPTDHKFKEVLAMRVVARIARAFQRGDEAQSASELAESLNFPVRATAEVIEPLRAHGVLVAVDRGGLEDSLLPARALESITVKNVLDALKGTIGPVEVPSEAPVDRRLDELLAGLDSEAAQSAHNVSLRELADMEVTRVD